MGRRLSKRDLGEFLDWLRKHCGYETGNRGKIDLVYLRTGSKVYLDSCCTATRVSELKILTCYVIVCYDSKLLNTEYGKPRKTLSWVLKYMYPDVFPYFSTEVEPPTLSTKGGEYCCCDGDGPQWGIESKYFYKPQRDWSHMYAHSSKFSELHDFTKLCGSYAELCAHTPLYDEHYMLEMAKRATIESVLAETLALALAEDEARTE
jgi:hypothetical protein